MKSKLTEIIISKLDCLDCGNYEYLHTTFTIDLKDCSSCYSDNVEIRHLKTIWIKDNGIIVE